MFGKRKLLLILPVIFLIPILLGMTPLNFVQKIGAGCPFAQGKQVMKCNPCPFNSIISQDDPTVVNLNLTPLDQESTSGCNIQVLDSGAIHPNITFPSIPLRC
jgi:hypothetical protein